MAIVIDDLRQDGRFALRQLVKSPGFTVTAVLMLTLGIGASVAIFGFVDAALIKPLPYRDPTRLLYVTESTPEIPRANLSYLDYLDWKKQNSSFSDFDVHGSRSYLLQTGSTSEIVPAARVSDGFFRTLGVTPILGRDFTPGEDLASAPPTVILTYGAWQSRFSGRSDVIGQSVTLSGRAYTIVGVLPRTFQFAPRPRAEVWTPLRAEGGCDLNRACHNIVGVARLKDGVSIETARAEMVGIARQLEQQYPDSNRDQGAVVIALAESIIGEVRPILLVLLGGAGLLLLIACVNVASLLLVRSESRRRELAVRRALGASRARLAGQFVTESIVLVSIGAALGLATAHWAMQGLTRLIPANMLLGMPYLQGLGLNARVTIFGVAIALLSAVLFALTPLWRASSFEMRDGMAEGSRGSAGTTWHRLGFKLVVIELATAMVLLVGAGLLGKSFYRLLNVDLGFQPDQLATLSIVVPSTGYPNRPDRIALTRRLMDRLGSVPGVESVAMTDVLPVNFNGNTLWVRFEGRPYNGEHNEVLRRVVTSTYFQTLKARLLRGRYFTDDEDGSKPRVVVINETLARRYFPGEDPIGRHIGDGRMSKESLARIVGIIEDVRDGPLDAEIWPAMYYAYNQAPDTFLSIVVRTTRTDPTILRTLTAGVREIDPTIAIADAKIMRDRINDTQVAYLRRSSTALVGGFAAFALLLGVIGLYGVIAYSVSQRTREIGVRMALGAEQGTVYRLVLREAGRLVVAGVVVGLICSVGAASLMRRLLFGTPPWDATTLIAVAMVLAVSALLASFIPARRAASVNPIQALRTE